MLRNPQPKKKGTKTFYSSPKTRCMSSPPYEKPPAKAKNNESSWAPPCTTNGVGSRSRPGSQTCPPTPNANYNVLVTQVRDGISAVSDEKTSRAGKPRVWKRARLGGETRSSGKVIKTHFVRDFSKFWFMEVDFLQFFNSSPWLCVPFGKIVKSKSAQFVLRRQAINIQFSLFSWEVFPYTMDNIHSVLN